MKRSPTGVHAKPWVSIQPDVFQVFGHAEVAKDLSQTPKLIRYKGVHWIQYQAFQGISRWVCTIADLLVPLRCTVDVRHHWYHETLGFSRTSSRCDHNMLPAQICFQRLFLMRIQLPGLKNSTL